MRKIIHYSFVVCFILQSTLSFGQSSCSQVTLSATSTVSTCRANGTITVSVKGADAANLRLSDAQFMIYPDGGIGYSTPFTTNGGLFSEVPPGKYNIRMKVFCNKSSDWEVFEGTTSVVVNGNYVEPNMYIITGEVRKTLNCKETGMIPVAFFDGVAPYTATLTEIPSSYSGQTIFTRGTAGRIEIDNLPEGTYTLKLQDQCNTKIDSLEVTIGKVSADFPTGGYASYVYPISYNSTDNDCKSITMRFAFTPQITADHELYYYLRDAKIFYDVYLTEGNNAVEKTGTITGSSTTSGSPDILNYLNLSVSLIDLNYGDIYPATTNNANILFKIKGCPSSSSEKSSFKARKPYSNISTSNYTCDSFDLYVPQFPNYNGFICYPYTISIKNATTGLVTNPPLEIHNTATIYAATLPLGKYIIEFTGKDGGKWWPSTGSTNLTYTMGKAPAYQASTYRYSYCPENGLTGYMYLMPAYPGLSFRPTFVPGTTIEVISAPPDQEIPPIQTLGANVTYFYPYAIISGSNINNYSPIVGGEHKFKISSPCVGVAPYILTVNFPVPSVIYGVTSSSTYCKANLGMAYSYIYSQETTIPGGTIFTFKGTSDGDPSAVIHPDFTMPSGTSKYFNPFLTDYTSSSTYFTGVKPGTYTFEVYDGACKIATKVDLVVPKTYSVENFSYTTDHSSCSNLKVYPTGKIKFGDINQTAYFKIYAAYNTNGSRNYDHDNRIIKEGEFLSLYKNGRYIIQISPSTSSCFSDTVSVYYEQPMPSLDLSATASYVCNGESTGYAKLLAKGGYGNGPYEYEIVGASPPQKNQTGIFNYGSPNEVLTIKVRDISPKTIALGCVPELEQKVTMLDLKDASIAFSPNNGKLCEGETIYLNSVSLGNTQYYWSGPLAYAATGQFQSIPNATVAHSGWYYVSVLPENCGENKIDSVLITVYPSPAAPTVNKTVLDFCYTSGTYSLLTASGATASAENTLRWYNADGITVITNLNIYTNNYANALDYYVCQVNKQTGCEGSRVKISVVIVTPPLPPDITYHPEVCYGDSIYLTLPITDASLTYRMYVNANTSVYLDEKTGTGGMLVFAPQRFTNPTSVTFYIAAIDNTGCTSSPRSSKTIDLATSATTANLTMKDKDTICINNSITLRAESTGITNPEYTWYKGPDLGSDTLGKGQEYTTPILNTISTYTYYVSVKGDNICDNIPGNRKLVTVRVNANASSGNITVSDRQVCYGEKISITPTAPSVSNPVFSWYTSQTETIPFYIGNTITTDSIFKDTIIYIGVSGSNYCENSPNFRKALKITVKTGGVPTLTQSNVSVCSGETTTLTASSSGITNPVYKWYDSPVATGPIFTGNPLVINNVTTEQTYWVSASGTTTCETLPVSRKSVKITPVPIADAGQILINDTIVCYNSSVILIPTAPGFTSPVFKWYVSQSALTHFTTGDFTTPPITNDTVFYVSVSGTNYCENLVRKPVHLKSKLCLDAKDDWIFVLPCQSVLIDVLDNDNLHGNTVSLEIPIAGEEPNKGTIVKINGNKITYTHTELDCLGGKTDTFSYAICISLGTCDTAMVYVGILPKPSIILTNACSYEPLLEVSPVFKGITNYTWEIYTDQNSVWSPAPGAGNSPTYKPTQAGKYRLTLTYDGKQVSAEITFIIHNKVDINGQIWYDTEIQ